MNQKGSTKDELYLIKLYQMASLLGDAFQEIDCYAVGKAAGYNDRSVDNIVRMLARTNFIKKGEGDSIFLTRHGEALVQRLLQ
jgi:hypothetical protein